MELRKKCITFVKVIKEKKDMKVEIQEVHSGIACGKQYIRFYNEQDNTTIGCVQVVNIEFYSLGGTTNYVVENYKTFKRVLCKTMADAIMELFEIKSNEEVDKIFDEVLNQLGTKNLYKESWRRFY